MDCNNAGRGICGVGKGGERVMSGKKSNSVNSGGISFAGLLAVLFIGLKLTGFIDWSWWWILSPLWVGLGIVLLLFAIVFIVAFLSD
jgi:hypothetical protein